LWREANRLVHWTSETWWEACEIAGSPQGSPPAADSVGCEARRETCSERETGTGKLCEIKWDCHIVGTDEALLMINHVGVTNVARQCYQENPGVTYVPPGDLNLWPLWREANRLVHWTSETWWEACEIAGSPQNLAQAKPCKLPNQSL
jgi:hypothetical protein